MTGENGVYYQTRVEYVSDKSTCPPVTFSWDNDLEAARVVLARDVRYYQDLNCAERPCQVVHAAITRVCAACNGAGQVRKARGRGTKLCPACRGRAPVVEETWISIPQSAWISELLRARAPA